MRSIYTIEEVGEMLDMKPSEVEKEIDNGNLGYSFHEGDKVVTLYDLEKYMGANQSLKVVQEYLQNQD